MRITGACHCGNISFTLDWKPDPTEIPSRACSCDFCTKHGAAWTSCATGALVVRTRDPANVSRYAFETKTADFLVCTRCGVAPLVTSRIDGRDYAVVNTNTFDNIDRALLRRSSVELGSESEAERLRRRARNWIGDVTFVEGAAT